MRFALLFVALAAFGVAPASLAQDGSNAASPSQTSPKAAPSLEQRRQRAFANLHSGRLRLPATYDEATPEEKAFVDSVLSGSRSELSGSTGTLMLSPVVGDLAQKTIAYTRFNSTVPVKLNELAIIIVARAWNSQVEWRPHKIAALKAGIASEIVDAIQVGKRPTNMPPDVEAIYNFCTELLDTKQVSDATYQAARSTLGTDQRVVDLIATLAMYQFTAMTLNVDQAPLPEGTKQELSPISSNH